MTLSSDHSWLQDYVDGRLSAADRAEAESRLRRDPLLARRVEELRAIGRALRAEPTELPPGFYTRARARFEQSQRRPRGLLTHLMSWEALGLAAAAMLVVALFVPVVLRDGGPGSAAERLDGVRSVDTELPPPASPGKEGSAVDEPVEAPKDRSLSKIEAERQPAERIEQEELSAVREVAEEDAAGDSDFAPVPQRAQKRADASRSRASAPSTAAGRSATAGVVADAVPEAEAASRYEAVATDDPPRVALPRLTAVPSGLLVIEEISTWAAWLDGPAGEALAPLGPPTAGRRLVLVGANGETDCASLSVRRTPEAHRVALPSTGGTASGCAFVLPADGLPVVREDGPGGTGE